MTIYTFATASIKEAKQAGRYSTAGIYNSALNSFFRFTGDKSITFKDLTPGLIKQYEDQLLGTVTDANGVLAGVNIDAGNNVTATTDANGVYMLTMKETGKYTLKFTAKDMESFESEATIPENAANRTQITLNVKMAKAISFENEKVQEETKTVEADKETTVNAVDTESTNPDDPTEEPATTTAISVPAQAAEEGTTIAAVVYEEPKAVEAEETPAETAPKEEAVPVTAVAIKVEPANAVAKAPIEIKTTITGVETTDAYFDPEKMEALKDVLATTRTAASFGKVGFKDGRYIITIPTGETIQGKYLTNILPSKSVSKVKQNEYNTVNGEEGVIKIENRDYSALNATLKVVTNCGWEYTTTPEAALQAVGAPTAMAAIIAKIIRESEGSKNGYYTVTKELKTAISGNNQLVFGSHCKTQEKSYIFPIFIKGTRAEVVVKLKCYVGYTEEYSNTPINKHSGGTTGK